MFTLRERSLTRIPPGAAVLICCLLLMVGGVTHAADQIEVWVRDSATGMSIPQAEVRAIGPTSGRVLGVIERTDASGRMSLQASGASVEIRAEGYRSMRVPAEPMVPGGDVTIVRMTARRMPEVLSQEVLERAKEPGMDMLHGYVVDVASGGPFRGAGVVVEGYGVRTTTDEQGYFRLYLPEAAPLRSANDQPEFADLVVSAPGYRSVRYHDMALIGHGLFTIIDIAPGSGEEVHDMRPRLFPRESEWVANAAPSAALAGRTSRIADAVDGSEGGRAGTGLETMMLPGAAVLANECSAVPEPPDPPPPPSQETTRGGLTVINPPKQIRVRDGSAPGWYDLDEYTRIGLCDEWIGSWGDNSIHSILPGAMAYRSYGAWHQLNNGSICASTSCQAFTSTVYPTCNTAAAATPGIVMDRDGAVAFSEYSAKLNSVQGHLNCPGHDLSCGDGYAGSPSAGWPCLADPVEQGEVCHGHGRGMSQWGGHRWASNESRHWPWILDHYYNDFGAGTEERTIHLASPYEIVSAVADQTEVTPGDSITLTVTVRSYAMWDQSNLLLSASLVSGGNELSDAQNDLRITVDGRDDNGIEYRDTEVSRQFVVPSGAAAGSYDLLVPIVFDANDNSSLDDEDKLMRWIRSSGAVNIN